MSPRDDKTKAKATTRSEEVNATIAAAIQSALAAGGGGSLPHLLGDLAEGTTALGPDGKAVSATYRKGDQDNPLGWTQERRGRLQRTLAEIGLLRGSYNSRLWGPDSAQAYEAVLATANRLGVDADAALELLRADDSLRSDVVGGELKVDPYLRPDPASVAKDVKRIFDGLLGREVTTDELPGLVAEYTSLDRQSYDQSLDAGISPTGAEPVVDDIDPAARFEALINDRYKPELDMRRGSAEAAASRDNLLASIGSLDQLLGIGGSA